jgi:hypothetical protein
LVILVQADAPINYNKELASDVELRGTFFINDNVDGFYVSFNNGIIQIDSDNHYTDKVIKIKGTALTSRLKKYNGFDVGYTHITDDGTITNEIKTLEIDSQGFAYLTCDFSTVIINGMTGTTTTTLTGLSGNQSISVPNGSSYDLNITNNQPSVWTINGTDYSKRVLWTLNITSVNLTDFQVGRITPYDSDMRVDMDDRQLTYYENDTLISFWDEKVINSVNATGYVKVPKTSTTEQQQFWMYYGNSDVSSASSGADTFIQYHGATSSQFLDSLIVPYSNIIYEGKVRPTNPTHTMRWGLKTVLDGPSGDEMSIDSYTPSNLRYTHTRNDGTQTSKSETPSLTSGTWVKLKIINDGTTAHYYVDDNEIVTGTTINLPNQDLGLIMYDAAAGAGEQDWSFVRKYTATEPTWAADDEEQTASGTVNITASVTGDNNTQSYNTSQSREFTLTPTGTTNDVLINTTSTDYDVTVTTYWTENTTLIEETVASGYAKQYINYTLSFNVTSADLNTTFTFNFSAQDYIGTASSTLNDVSKTTTRDGQDVNASVGSLAADTPYWWNVTVPYNNIFTLSEQSSTIAFLGVSKQFSDSTYNDPEGLPIDSRLWKFGDGNTSSSSNPSHIYTTVGEFNANYSVTETATVSPQTILREFNVSVEVQPPQNVTTIPHQTNVSINWDDYVYADKYSVYELEDGFPYVDTDPAVDGVKDAIYDYAHEFLIFSPNPVNPGDYDTSYPVRTSLGAYFFHEAVDNDDKLGDDDLIYYFDLDYDGLTVDDPAWKITNNNVKKYLWNGNSWQVTGVSDAVGASTGGSTHYPKHELFIPIAELGANWTNGSTVKVLVKREDSSLSLDVITWYPYGNINNTDTSLWQEMALNEPESYTWLANVTSSNYTATNLTPFTIYHGAVSAWNGTDESDYTLFDVITEDLPIYSASGYISDTDGNPIADATVYSCNGFIVEITTTNVSGYWIGYKFRENNYTICASKTGYYDNSIDIFVDSNLTNQNITLSTVPVIVSKYHKIGEMLFAIPTILKLVFQKIADVIPIFVVLVFIMLIINVIGVAIHAIRVWR